VSTFRFEPPRRRRRGSRFVGTIIEPEPVRIPLPATVESLRALLADAAHADPGPLPHHAIARWCRAAWEQWYAVVEQWYAAHDTDAPPSALPFGGDARALDVAEDVDAQFDLYLFNTFAPAALDGLDAWAVRLPREWFVGWLDRLAGESDAASGAPDT
jgi:hypothetical protein